MAALDPNAPNEFDLARKRAAGQANKQNQMQQDALKRRAASLGNMSGGAFIKQQQEAIRDTGQQLAQANEGIDTAQRAEVRRVNEIKEARDFSRGEREASQKFASGERDASQKFASGESALSRQQQADQFGQNLGFQKEQLAQQAEQFKGQMELAFKEFKFKDKMSDHQIKMAGKAADLAMKQFDLQEKTEAFNAIQSIANQKLSPDQINAMIGILGPEIMENFKGDIPALFGKESKTTTSASPKTADATSEITTTENGTKYYNNSNGKRVMITPNGKKFVMYNGEYIPAN